MRKERFSIRLQQALKVRGIRQSELSRRAKVPKSAISQYLSNKFEPNQNRIELLASVLDVSEIWLMGYDVPMTRDSAVDVSGIDNIIPMPKMNKIPLLGAIACGDPILAQENIDEEISIPEHIKADFALRCKGDSMIDARINDGDIVYIKQQSTVDNGQIAAVLIDTEATLKRVFYEEGTLTLLACNAKYRPYIYAGEKLNEIKILGKAVGFASAL